MPHAALRAALPCAAGTLSLLVAPAARAQLPPDTHVWTGGGTSDNWSDSGNWEDNRVPASPAADLEFRPGATARHTSRQDIADPMALVGGMVLQPVGHHFEISGNGIRLVGTAAILDDTRTDGSRVISAALQFDDALEIAATRGSPSNPGLSLMDVSGSGSLVVREGLVRLARATYAGTTTVSNGNVQIGGWVREFGSPENFVTGSTEGQGNYLIGANGVLSGTGTIGLASGKKVTIENGGVLSPDYFALGPVATKLTVNGDVRFGDGGRYSAWAYAPTDTDLLDVNGVLDLTGAGDVLHFGGFMVPTGSVVVAEYESRLGEFDVFDYQLFDPGFPFPTPPGRTATLSYTSAPGAGPGQVVVTVVPEPVGAGIAVIAAGAILMRRRGR